MVSAPLPKDDPRMLAWEAYTQTEQYANTLKWATTNPEYADGCLWAAFEQGWRAAKAAEC